MTIFGYEIIIRPAEAAIVRYMRRQAKKEKTTYVDLIARVYERFDNQNINSVHLKAIAKKLVRETNATIS